MVVISQFCIAKHSQCEFHTYIFEFWILTIENVTLRTTIWFSIDFNIQQSIAIQMTSKCIVCWFLLFLAFLLIVSLVLWPLAIEWGKKKQIQIHIVKCTSVFVCRFMHVVHISISMNIFYICIFISNQSTSIMLSLILTLYHSLSAHVMYY